jgi:hypothetical protein
MVVAPRVRGGGCQRERRHPELEEVGVAAGLAMAGDAAAGASPRPWAGGGRGWRGGQTMG